MKKVEPVKEEITYDIPDAAVEDEYVEDILEDEDDESPAMF